jgi:sugar phosphate isomerase/epimerase
LKIPFDTGVAVSPRPTAFGPVLFSGRLDEGLRTISQCGLKLVEFSLRSIQDVNPRQVKNRLDELGLELSAVATGQACLFDSLCLCAQDNDLRRMAIEHFKRISTCALELDARKVIIGGIRGKLTGMPDEQLRQYDAGVQAIKECAQWLDAHGMNLLVEPINRYEANWILTASEGIAFLNEINVPSAKLLLDTFHMNIEEASIPEAIRAAGDKLGYVHFADNTRHAPGQGQTDFNSIIRPSFGKRSNKIYRVNSDDNKSIIAIWFYETNTELLGARHERKI